jgi:hypothetical protein
MPSRTRSIADDEIALIKRMISNGFEKTKIQAYFTHPERPVNFGRITNIQNNEYGPGVLPASENDLQRFLDTWGVQRGVGVESVIAEALDPKTLPPTDPRRLASYFEKRDGNWYLIGNETDEIECKTSFGLSSKVLRAIAALSNNRGGHILFGVGSEQHKVVGLQNSKFSDTDPSRISQAIRDSMEPMPRVEVSSCTIGGALVGAFYVHAEFDGPVIASKTEQELKEGTIYYRYPGESRAIGAAEFRGLLAKRDARIRHQSSEDIARLMELGPRATVVDVGRTTRESSRIVREGIDDADVLRNFVRQEVVEFPLAYLLRSCSTTKSWLPIFYYIKLSGLPLSEVVDVVVNRETSYVARKRDLLARLSGKKTSYTRASGRSERTLKQLLKGQFVSPTETRTAVDLATAMISLPDSRLDMIRLLRLLRESIDIIRADRALKIAVWSYVYKASARIDELYYHASK